MIAPPAPLCHSSLSFSPHLCLSALCSASVLCVCESLAEGVSFALTSPVTGSIAWTESDSDHTLNLRNQTV